MQVLKDIINVMKIGKKIGQKVVSLHWEDLKNLKNLEKHVGVKNNKFIKLVIIF
jgi:hypothetical protein